MGILEKFSCGFTIGAVYGIMGKKERGRPVELHESGQMYLETIHVLLGRQDAVRAIDVGNHLGYSKPSVSRALGLLKQDGYITVDGDGQHHKLDILACAETMKESDKLTLGVRDFDHPDVPFRSRFGNKTTCGIFKLFVGMSVSDTQTGLRAIPRKDLPTMLAIEGDRFEYETNMLLALKQKSIPFREVKIRTVYIEENKSSHFRVIRDSWRIYKLILAHFFRYTLVSIGSAVLDEGCYVAFSGALQGILAGLPLTASATAAARLISSLFNFFMNKKVVFQSGVSTGKALLRYYALALPMLIAQALLTHGAYALFGIPENAAGLRALIYAVVMTVLYLVSYMVQQRWVFHEKREDK